MVDSCPVPVGLRRRDSVGERWDWAGKRLPHLLSLAKSVSPNTYNGIEMHIGLWSVHGSGSSLPPFLPVSFPSFHPNAWDSHRTSVEELHKTIQLENNVAVTVFFIGTLNLGSNTCLNYIFHLKVNLFYWHATSNSIKAKWNTQSI